MEARETEREAAPVRARRTLWLAFPSRSRAEQRQASGASSLGCFIALAEHLEADVDYEIYITEIPEGAMAASAWLQEAEDGVPHTGTARFTTDGVALDVRHGALRILGRHDFKPWPLPAGIMLILHW